MTDDSRPRNVSHTALVCALALAVAAGCDAGGRQTPPGPQRPGDETLVTPTPFAERNGKDVFNASGIVPVGDSHFIVVDNNTNDALLDLRLTADGKQAQPIERLPLEGLPADSVDDIEDLALAEGNGRRYIFATPSLSVKAGSKKKGKDDTVRPSALLRIAVGDDGKLTTEAMPEFRDWFVKSVPAITPSAGNDPEYGGLNIEGLGWDPDRQAMLFGIRTPVVAGAPIIVPVRIKEFAGPWAVGNLEALEPIRLEVESGAGNQGIRGMSRGRDGKGFLVVVANATSDDEVPFAVYEWDGNQQGTVHRLPFAFADKMKAEGLTVATVGGRPAIVFVDDGGGYQVVWL